MWERLLSSEAEQLAVNLECEGNLPSGVKAETGSKRVPQATTELNKFLNELISLNLCSQMTIAFCWEMYLNLLFPACPSSK